MQQLGDLELTTHSLYEPQIRDRVFEGLLSSATPAHQLLAQREAATRTHKGLKRHFRGRLKVDGLNFSLPDQDFSFHFTEVGGYIENHPVAPWPIFRIDLVFNSLSEQLEIKSYRVASADSTVDAGLLYTRIVFALFASRKLYLQEKNAGNVLEFVIDKPPLSEEKMLLSQSKLFRKLKYLESIFDIKFLVPREISVAEASQIEIIFRGLTEGKVTVRSGKFTFCDYAPSIDKLNGSPFTEPGPLTHTYTEYKLAIFDQQLPVGSVIIHLERAAVANPRVLDSLHTGEQQSVNLRLIVFDHQITFYFEKYAKQAQQLRRKLDRFEEKLTREEPAQLVRSLTDSFSENVSADEASQIVMGWLQFYHFPDRYCPQEPKFEEDRWRVPIWVTYANGQGAWVQDAFVDLKTGVVTVPVSAEELRNLGKSVAAECLRAS